MPKKQENLPLDEELKLRLTIFSRLRKLPYIENVPEEFREEFMEVLEGKEKVIEVDTVFGKVECRFQPISADDLIKDGLERQVNQEPLEVYNVGERSYQETPRDLHKPFAFSKNLANSFSKFISELVDTTNLQPLNVGKIVKEDFLEKHSNVKRLKDVLKIKPGGARKRKGFTWTEENKILFYEAVINLPKIKGKSIWHYAFNELMEKDFHYTIISYLKTETEFRSVPELFDKAVKTWRKYKDSLENPTEEDNPDAFERLHALKLLDFPETKFSTMKRYFGDGKKLYNL